MYKALFINWFVFFGSFMILAVGGNEIEYFEDLVANFYAHGAKVNFSNSLVDELEIEKFKPLRKRRRLAMSPLLDHAAPVTAQPPINDHAFQLTEDQWEIIKEALTFPMKNSIQTEENTKSFIIDILTKFDQNLEWSVLEPKQLSRYNDWHGRGHWEKLCRTLAERSNVVNDTLLTLFNRIENTPPKQITSHPKVNLSDIPDDYKKMAQPLVKLVPGKRIGQGRSEQELLNFIMLVFYKFDNLDIPWAALPLVNICRKFNVWYNKKRWHNLLKAFIEKCKDYPNGLSEADKKRDELLRAIINCRHPEQVDE